MGKIKNCIILYAFTKIKYCIYYKDYLAWRDDVLFFHDLIDT